MHTSVFLQEAIDALDVQSGRRYIDATYGQGGHARLIAEKGGEVLGIDADPAQVERAQPADHIRVMQGNFSDLAEIAHRQAFVPVAGVLFDYGLSMMQLAESGRGFSYNRDTEPLDMRLSQTGETVIEYLASVEEKQLESDLMKYSEDVAASDIAQAIYRTRHKIPVRTVGDLKQIIDEVVSRPGQKESPEHTYARIFQALRIVVNHERESIIAGLDGALEILEDGGRIVTITFHSLEDRTVKTWARTHRATIQHERREVHRTRPLQSFERSATLRVMTKQL